MPPTTFKQVDNNISGALVSAIDITQTTLTLNVGQGAQFPTVFPFFCSVDYEVLLCTNRVGDVLTVTRGQDQTQAAIHNIGSVVEIREVAALFREAYTAINSLEAGGANFPNPFIGLHLISPVVDSGGIEVNGSPTGYTDEIKFGNLGASGFGAFSMFQTGAPQMIFDHRGASNTGSWLYRNGTNGGTVRMSLSGAGLLTASGGIVATSGGIEIQGAAGTQRELRLTTVASQRWTFVVSGAEGGANAGADFSLQRFSDAGGFISAPLSIVRSTGLATFSAGLVISNGHLGVGTAPTTNMNLYITDITSGSVNQYGIYANPISDSGATNFIAGIFSAPRSAVATFSTGFAASLYVGNPVTGSGSTIVSKYGLLIDSLNGAAVGAGAAATSCYGIQIATPTNATTNNVGIRLIGGSPALIIDSGGLVVTAGNIAIGSVTSSAISLRIGSSLVNAAGQYGIQVSVTGGGGATTEFYGVNVGLTTSAIAGLIGKAASFHASNLIKNAPSTITSAYGLIVDSITVGNTNNYGIYVDTPSGGSGHNVGVYVAGGGIGILGAAPAITGGLGIGYTVTATATTGGIGALPAQPSGYLSWTINGVIGKIPYYNA